MKLVYSLALAAATLSGAVLAEAPVAKNQKIAEVKGRVIDAKMLVERRAAMPELRYAPDEQVLPALLDQLIVEALLKEEAQKSNLKDDPKVKELVARCEEVALLQVFMEKEVSKRFSESDLKKLYETQKKDFKSQKQVKIRQILTKTKEEADAAIKLLNSGRQFAEVAKQKSIDPTSKDRGGEWGNVTKDVAAKTLGDEFAEQIFMLKPGHYTKSPVSSRLGFHVVLVEDASKTTFPTFEVAKKELTAFKQQEALLAYLQELVSANAKDIKMFDENGNVVEMKKAPEKPVVAA